MDLGNKYNPHGSSRFVTEAEIEAAGLFEYTEDAIYGGKAFGRRLWFKQAGGVVLVAGARMGKLRDLLCQTICHSVLTSETVLIVDIKCELAPISQDQIPDRKHCIYWNPHDRSGMPQHRTNPLCLMRWSSPSLVSDIKLFMAGQLPETGAGSAKYFELNARRVGEALALSLTETLGELTLPALYFAILALQSGGTAWAPYADQLRDSSRPELRALEQEIARAQQDASGGWNGIKGELMQAFACLSDDLLRASVSPPFDFDMQKLADLKQAYQFYLMCPELMVEEWAPVVKSILTCARTIKARAPEAPRQTWLIDEAARFKGYGEIADLYTVGAGLGIRPYAVFQDVSQMNDLAPNAQRKIISSAAVQIYFGTREPESAKFISDILGVETLRYDDPLEQGRAKVSFWKMLRSIFDGEDPFKLAIELGQKRYEIRHPKIIRRMIRTPDEVISTPDNRMYIKADGLRGPIYGEREPYWDQPWMAGRYFPNPYHPPLDEVWITTNRGWESRKISARKAPERIADYPQYQDGIYTYVEGYDHAA